MSVENQLPLRHSNRYSADSACAYCDGLVHHESWCATQNANVYYAFEAVLDPTQLSVGDELSLRALGVVWTTERISVKRRASQQPRARRTRS
jgi:hypothetical protein